MLFADLSGCCGVVLVLQMGLFLWERETPARTSVCLEAGASILRVMGLGSHQHGGL